MQAEFLLILPPEVQDMMAKLERSRGREITVEMVPADELRKNPELGHTVHLHRDCSQARIWLHKPDVGVQPLVHEVLHLKRDWLDKAWRFTPSRRLQDPQLVNVLADISSRIEEVIEHAFWIIPEEKRLGVFDPGVWNRDFRLNLDNSTQCRPGEPQQRESARNWVAMKHLVTDADLVDSWRAKLQEWNCLGAAERYEAALRAAYPNKQEMLRLTVRQLPLGNGLLEIVRCKARSGKLEYAAI